MTAAYFRKETQVIIDGIDLTEISKLSSKTLYWGFSDDARDNLGRPAEAVKGNSKWKNTTRFSREANRRPYITINCGYDARLPGLFRPPSLVYSERVPALADKPGYKTFFPVITAATMRRTTG